MTDVILCVDIGTTSLKAGFITAAGEVVSFSSIPYNSSSQDWLLTLKEAVNELFFKKMKSVPVVKKIFTAKSVPVVKAISISGNGPTLVSQEGKILHWNEYADSEELLQSENEISKTCGKFSHSIFLPRILLYKKVFESDFEKTDFLFSGPEYLCWKLTGNVFTVLPEARFETAYWNKEILQKLNINSKKIPDFVELGHCFGLLKEEISGYLDLPSVPVFCIGPDFIAGLIGTDTIEQGTLCDRCGSSEGINFCVNKEIHDERVRTLPCVSAGLWNISVLIPNSADLPEDQRLQKVVEAVLTLKSLAEKNGIDFPKTMTVTGGQIKDKKYFEKKKKRLKKMGITICQKDCADAELLGDSKVAWQKLKLKS